jgi:hypothetical protein
MTWIRGHIRSCAWLALTALALHVALTFGHVHLEQFSPASIAATPTAASDANAGDDANGMPDEQYRALRAGHFCAICASIGLMGTSVLPVAHILAPLPIVLPIRGLGPSSPAPPHGPRSSAKARAPPSA